MLQIFNIPFETAYSGEIALTKIKEKFENSNCCRMHTIIFMDIEMPVKDGYSTCRDIKNYLE